MNLLPSRRTGPAAADPGPDRLDRLLADLTEGRSDVPTVDPRGAGNGVGEESPARGGEWVPPAKDDTSPADEAMTRGRHRAAPDPVGRERVLRVPEGLRGAEVAVGRPAVVGMLLLVLLVGAVVGVRVWWADQRAEASTTVVPVAPSAPTSPSPTHALAGGSPGPAGPVVPGSPGSVDSAASASGSPPASPPPAPAPVLVHVDGAVGRPGVVEVPAQSRVQDVLERAGGLSSDADTTRLNLARPVQDGERVWVPRAGEEVPGVLPVEGGAASGGGAGRPGGTESAPVDLNAADLAALDEVPGIGPVTAERILAWREQHGRFTAVEELLEVSGIGERTLEEIRPHVTV